MIGTELEQVLRRMIREEIGRALGGDPAPVQPDDDTELQELAIERAAKLRRAGSAR